MLCVFITTCVQSQEINTLSINTNKGHDINRGVSGFNVRIADKVWSYTHPDFVKSVKELKPGWLRFFSGTMGDAFSSATGLYDLDFISMFDHKNKQFKRGYRFTDVKGPHRLIDLYKLLGDINASLVITVNAFSETPEMVLELARFCKNNNIKVETWQFCNEPYFYIPNRNRYWWNDGYDYAVKMKPYAQAVKQVFPDANLALNYTWDGVWTFMKDIEKYQKEHGPYWNVFSKHSYAPHIGRKESLEEAYRRGNTKLIEATSSNAMEEIEAYTWEDVPMIITEFGIWNKPLNGIYAGVYNIEYVMRQLEHPNTKLVGAHEVSNKYFPLDNKNEIIEDAYKNQISMDTDTLLTGIKKDLEGKAYKIYHEATNNSNFIFETTISDSVKVPGLNSTPVNGIFAQTYKGINGYNYVVVTNRSNSKEEFQVIIDGKPLKEKLFTTYLASNTLNTKEATIKKTVFKNGVLTIKPFSVTVSKWKTDIESLQKPRIYTTKIKENGVVLNWGAIPNATSYKVYYGINTSSLNSVKEFSNNTGLINNLTIGKSYFFKVNAISKNYESPLSNAVELGYKIPGNPKIFKTSRRDTTVTVFWKSVANANHYVINYVNEEGKALEINTGNVFGYRINGLKNNTNYTFTVTAVNGLGKSIPSAKASVFVSNRVPFSPRNVSATKVGVNTIKVKWYEQDKVLENTCYNLYRGTKLYEFNKIASCLKDTVYIDENIVANKQYYYVVKAETEVGESNFHANIATTFSSEKNNKITIQFINKTEEGYLVKVNLTGITINENDIYGILINNISYLNVENIEILSSSIVDNEKSFKVIIPFSKVKKGSNYTIKAFLKNKDGVIESPIVNQYIQKK